MILPSFCGYASLWVEPRDLGGILGLEVRRNLVLAWPRFCKWCFDVVVCAIGMVVAIPLGILFAVLIMVTSRGSPIYGHERIGRAGRRFTVWKFRTMVKDADRVLERHLDEHPELRQEWEQEHKLRNDPRVTAVGRFLRATSLDELPQFWNVIRGEMSLVGPRPIVEAEVFRYRDMFDLYLQVRPGISGLWQVSGRSDTTYDERVALDVAYVRNWSVWLDVWILLRTVRAVIRGKGAY
jgi:Undecaprenyl-phosphate galactose phosphotransferase WbaP